MSMDSPDLYGFDDDGLDAPDFQRRGLIGATEQRLLGLADDGKRELARSFGELVDLVRDVAAHVDSLGLGPVGGMVREATGVLEGWERQLRDRPVAELLNDGRALVRRQPQIAIGVATLAGFIAARLVKSGAR